MGVWNLVRLAGNLFNRLKPNVTSVTDVCKKGFDASRSATAHVDGAVRTKVREVHEYLTDDQLRDIFTRFAKHLSKNGALYVVRCYGGGPIIDIVSQSFQDKAAATQENRIKQLEAKLARLERLLKTRTILVQEDFMKASTVLKSQQEPSFNLDMNQSPEVLLRIVMMRELGTRILDDLIVPGPGSKRKVKPVKQFEFTGSNKKESLNCLEDHPV